MPSTKDYNVKLSRLKNTQKITRTMKLVSMSKLYRAHDAQKKAKIYAQKLKELTARLAASSESTAHPFLTPHKTVKTALVLVIASDKGLCGSFNNSVFKKVTAWLSANRANYQTIHFACCGKRSNMFIRRLTEVKKYYEGTTANPNFNSATLIGEDLSRAFLSEGYDEIFIAYNIFNNPLSQKPTIEKILPIESTTFMEGGEKLSSQYLFEPPSAELLGFLIPKYLYFRIYFALLENSAGEHGARMTAMDSATKNTKDLIGKNTLLRNRARQTAITKELIEIVSGAEALKG